MFKIIPVSETELLKQRRQLAAERQVAITAIQMKLEELRALPPSLDNSKTSESFRDLMTAYHAVTSCEKAIARIDSIRSHMRMEDLQSLSQGARMS